MKKALICLTLLVSSLAFADEVKDASALMSTDPVKAESLLKKAAGKGNKDAAAALETMKQREARKADIEYWTSKYDGSEFFSGKHRCPAPRIPAISKQDDEVKSVTAKMLAWETCFNATAVEFGASNPLTKRIPADVAALMTKEETEKAKVHLEAVFSSVNERLKVAAKLVMADFGAWTEATAGYIREHNRIVKENKDK